MARKVSIRFAARSSKGFSLIELVTVVGIVAVLMGLGATSFRYITNSNRISAEINGLLGDLQYARAEAMKEGRTVTVCASADGATCTGTPVWTGGWIVFSDPTNIGTLDPGETLLRVQKPLANGDTLQDAGGAIAAVTFNRAGFAVNLPGLANALTLHDSTASSSWTRCLSITSAGMMAAQTHVTTAGCL